MDDLDIGKAMLLSDGLVQLYDKTGKSFGKFDFEPYRKDRKNKNLTEKEKEYIASFTANLFLAKKMDKNVRDMLAKIETGEMGLEQVVALFKGYLAKKEELKNSFIK